MQSNVKNTGIPVLLKEYYFEINLPQLDIVSFTVIEEKYRTGDCASQLTSANRKSANLRT